MGVLEAKGRVRVSIDLFAFGVLCLGLLISRPVRAQVAGATLSGVVSDPSGSVIPNAKVSIKDTETGVVREVDSNSTGIYTAPNLQPGAYEVTVSANGFSTRVQSGITLTVGAEQTLNVTLQVGSVNQTVEITAEAPTVELTSSSISDEVQGNTIRELPLNGRDWTSLATLEPGVNSMVSTQTSFTSIGGGQTRAIRGYGAQMSIDGGRPFTNNYRVDGITINDYDNSAPGNALGVSMGVDAIQEFSVLTNNFSAAYGRTSGGVVNAITRSGTNQFHGSVYEFIRNSALDARNFFDPPTIPAFRRNQFGASGGAPIKKDKSFIFADYEGMRQFLGDTLVDLTPSAAIRNGYTCILATDPTPNCSAANSGIKSTIAVSPLVTPYLGLWALPNDGLLANGNTGDYQYVSNLILNANYGIIRFDHHFSDKDSFFASYVHDSSEYTQSDALGDVTLQQTTGNQRIALAETHIFGSQFVNSVRIGYNRVADVGGGATGALNPLAGEASLGIIGADDAPGITVTGITAFVGGVVGQSQSAFTWNSLQGYDDATYALGKHNLQFGFGVESDQVAAKRETGPDGGFTYGSLTAFLTNAAPTQFSIQLPTPTDNRDYRETIFGAYFQDDWRLRKNLTVNLGVRYEPLTTPSETLDRFVSMALPSSPMPRLGSPFFNNPSLRNFAPRLGFAWDPFGDGKTSVRSGFGIFDVDTLPYEYILSQALAYPYGNLLRDTTVPSTTAAPAFPDNALPAAIAAGSQTGTYVEQNPHRSYMMQWNLSVQRQVLPSLTIMAAYVGSRGVHLPWADYDVNMVLPTSTPEGFMWPTTTGVRQNPAYGAVFYNVWDRMSTYNALETQVTKQYTHGFQLQGSFTWSKSIDNATSGPSPNSASNTLQNPPFFANDRALSDFNVKDILVINGLWEAPKPKMGNRALNTALGGWELGGLFTARTGVPFTVGFSGDPLGTLDTSAVDYPDYLKSNPGCSSGVNPGNVAAYINISCFTVPLQNGTTLTSANCKSFSTVANSCSNLMGNSGRNSLIGPGSAEVDFSVIKNNQITEKFNAQFRAEMFNVLNRANFNFPAASGTGIVSIFGPTGAPVAGATSITSTATTSRQIQFALKLIW